MFYWYKLLIYLSQSFKISAIFPIKYNFLLSLFLGSWKKIFKDQLDPFFSFAVHFGNFFFLLCFAIVASFRLSSVPPVLLPERLLVQAASFGGEKSAGPNSGWVCTLFWGLVIPIVWTLEPSAAARLANGGKGEEWRRLLASACWNADAGNSSKLAFLKP